MRLLILGTGIMARAHARAFARIDGVKIVAASDLSAKRLALFCGEHAIPNRFTSLEDAIAWGRFDAVANVTPDSVHHKTTLACLAAGKHVFCEKPLATSHADALEMTEAAERAGLVNMVNLTYRGVAGLQAARKKVLAGDIGAVKHVEASYLQSWLSQPAWGDWRTGDAWLWRLSTAHGSNGVLGDIGIHIVDFATYGAGQDLESLYCRLHTFPKAEGDRIGEYFLDANDSFAMSVIFANGALGMIHASRWATGHINDLQLRIFGGKGGLEVIHRNSESRLRTCLGADLETGTWSDTAVEPVPGNYQRFAAAVAAGKGGEPDFRHAAQLQKVLDLAIVSDQAGRDLDVSNG